MIPKECAKFFFFFALSLKPHGLTMPSPESEHILNCTQKEKKIKKNIDILDRKETKASKDLDMNSRRMMLAKRKLAAAPEWRRQVGCSPAATAAILLPSHISAPTLPNASFTLLSRIA